MSLSGTPPSPFIHCYDLVCYFVSLIFNLIPPPPSPRFLFITQVCISEKDHEVRKVEGKKVRRRLPKYSGAGGGGKLYLEFEKRLNFSTNLPFSGIFSNRGEALIVHTKHVYDFLPILTQVAPSVSHPPAMWSPSSVVPVILPKGASTDIVLHFCPLEVGRKAVLVLSIQNQNFSFTPPSYPHRNHPRVIIRFVISTLSIHLFI